MGRFYQPKFGVRKEPVVFEWNASHPIRTVEYTSRMKSYWRSGQGGVSRSHRDSLAFYIFVWFWSLSWKVIAALTMLLFLQSYACTLPVWCCWCITEWALDSLDFWKIQRSQGPGCLTAWFISLQATKFAMPRSESCLFGTDDRSSIFREPAWAFSN